MIKKSIIALALISSNAFALEKIPASVELAKNIPLVDVHMHIEGNATGDFFVEKMAKNNVAYGGAVGMYRPHEIAKVGDRFIPTFGQLEWLLTFRNQGQSGLEDPANFRNMFAEADRLFKEGRIKGFGEIHTSNRNSGHPLRHRHIKTNSPVVEKMYEVANQYNGFVQIHTEYDGQLTKDLKYLSETYPNVTTILSHCLFTTAAKDIEEVFNISKNIYCEISATGPYHSQVNRIRAAEGGKIYTLNGPRDQWVEVINKYQDRIMIGTDPCCNMHRDYDTMVEEVRTMFLPYFEPKVVQKLAYENAVRVFKLDPKLLEKN